MLFLPITKSWLVSRSARLIFLVSAILGLGFFGLKMALALLLGVFEQRQLEASPVAHTLGILFGLPGIVGLAVLWVAMWYYWFSLDPAHGFRKDAWFVVLFVFGPLGALIYYFSYYLHTVEAVAHAVSGESGERRDVARISTD